MKSISSMTFLEFWLKVINRVRPLKRGATSYFKKYVSNDRKRKKFNKFYNKRSFDEKNIIQNLTSKLFRNGHGKFEPGTWEVKFRDQVIKLPLREENIWLDWDNAVSIIGHDVNIKKTYEGILKSDLRPAVFFDIGANYGTHSLLFLSQGVKVISFEPNPTCRTEFESACRLNDFHGKVEPTALGNQTGTVSLYFPEDNTWLGTIQMDGKASLEKDFSLKEIKVDITTLDNYTESIGLFPDLMKIDTEGNELSVLEGGVKTIQRSKPLIIFETNTSSERKALFAFFKQVGYGIYTLPYIPGKENSKLDIDSFQICSSNNFIATPI